jgi:hypothetical protein
MAARGVGVRVQLPLVDLLPVPSAAAAAGP